MRREPLEVHCYSGHTYADRPDSFFWLGKQYHVSDVIKSWQEPGTRHFAVRVDDGGVFHLEYSETKGEWSVID